MAYYHRYRSHLFVLVGANPGNAFVSTDARWAWNLAAWFRDLFSPSNYKLAVFVDYGIAAAFYLVIGRIAERLVDRI
jgi:hypothetical protein